VQKDNLVRYYLDTCEDQKRQQSAEQRSAADRIYASIPRRLKFSADPRSGDDSANFRSAGSSYDPQPAGLCDDAQPEVTLDDQPVKSSTKTQGTFRHRTASKIRGTLAALRGVKGD
jgi:hypothetical protein